ncbi:putative plasmid replication initiator protein [Mycolicibacterium cyprinidarum]|nr:putative plasmid replication initiator protein [Mycolicibacterium sp. NGTWS1803]
MTSAAPVIAVSTLPGLPAGTDATGVVAQMVRRAASRDFETWWNKAENAGFCANPIRLTGTDSFGREHRVWTRCNNRRAVACPSCSDLYARDTWQLVHAGLHGGHHDLPPTVAEHPQVFVTLTAPSFGAVHTTHDNGQRGQARRCHDRGRSAHQRCQHGRPRWCSSIHHEGDAHVGQPLCEDCYDYMGHVLFAWHAPELWRRFTIALRRLLRRRLRALGESPTAARINFVKVTEMQRRAIPHFHAIIRLDGPPQPGQPPTPPNSSITATDLALLIHQAATGVALTVAAPARGAEISSRVIQFGTQTDTRPLQSDSSDCDTATPRQSRRSVAAYLAKYVTKSVADFGVGIRRMSPLAVPDLDVTTHVRAILTTILDLADHGAYSGIDRWLHTLGFRGHITTKSRLFSTTMGALREHRAQWTREQRRHRSDLATEERDRALHGAEETEWTFDRAGLGNLGERTLVVSAAHRMIEHRHIVRANRWTHDQSSPPDWST